MVQYGLILYQAFLHVASVRLLSAEANEECASRVAEVCDAMRHVMLELAVHDQKVFVAYGDLLNSLTISFEKVNEKGIFFPRLLLKLSLCRLFNHCL